MRKIAIISSAALSLILGIVLPACAQQDQQNEKQDKHEQKQEPKKQDKPGNHQAQQPQNHEGQRQPAEHQVQNQERQQPREQEREQQRVQPPDQGRRQQRDQQPQDRQQQARQVRPQGNQEQQRAWQNTWQSHRASSWQSDHRTWQQRGGYNGYRIPQDRYRGYFGPQHSFRISGLPFAVYGGNPRFQYEGYWITLLDPWPESWSNNWYDDDDVYVDYRDDGGYYMYNRRYPAVAIAISVSM